MFTICKRVLPVLLACSFAVSAFSQTQDMKDATNSTKKAAKKSGHKVKKGTKKATQSVKEKTQ